MIPVSLQSTSSNNNSKVLGPNYAIGNFDGVYGMSLDGFSVDGIPALVKVIMSFGSQSHNIFGRYPSNEISLEFVVGGVYLAQYIEEFSYWPVQDMISGRTGY